MLRFPLLAITLAAIMGCASEPATAPTTDLSSAAELSVIRSNQRIERPVDVFLINSCYNPPVGEGILLSGNVVTTRSDLVTPTGRLLRRLSTRYEAVSGVGLTTGVKYRVIQNNHQTIHVDVGGVHSTATFTFNVIGQGPVANFIGHFVLVIAISPDGTVEHFINRFSIKCR